MNNKFGRDGRYRDLREPFWRGSHEDRALRSPDQEFETSGNYREPRESYGDVSSAGYAPDSSSARYNQYGRNAGPSSERSGGFAGRGPKDYARSDERIREDVCERLSWDDEVDATDISVRVEAGEVTLEGSVETRHMKRLAEDLADRVPGVIDVHNTVRVTKPVLTELKEKLTGEAPSPEHYANTGTKQGAMSSRHGTS